jgi:hypothetical protein
MGPGWHSCLGMAGEEGHAGLDAVAEAGSREGYGSEAGLPRIPSRASSPRGVNLLA